MSDNKVVTRFAPSPTGFLHLGNYRTAIFAYLYAKKHKGNFVLRIEDTDRERSKKEYEENIIESLKWLGLDYDKFYRQSEHVDKHKFYLEKMIKEGNAYISKEEAKDGSGVIKELVRFKNPNIDVTFKDEIKGDVTMNTKDLGDFIIAKNISEPLFHLAVVVDDFEAGITHVIRGEDHVSNTPRQVLIQRAIGAPTPIYAHMPLVLGPDKLKLSKRRDALPLTEYKKQGFLPEAILNGVAFVGWNPGTEKEIFTRDELIEAFDFSRVQKSPAIFNEEKLEWFNKEHMKLLPKEEIKEEILKRLPEEMRKKDLVPVIFERISKWGDVEKWVEERKNITSETTSSYDKTNAEEPISVEIKQQTINILKSNDYLDPSKDPLWNEINALFLIPKDLNKEIVINYLIEAKKLIEENDWVKIIEKNNENKLWIYSGEKGRGKVLSPLRVALSGSNQSIDLFEIMKNIGKDSTLRRVKNAIEALNNKNNKNNVSTQSSVFTLKE